MIAAEVCSVDGCGRNATSGRLCATHRRRKRLHLPMMAPIKTRATQAEEALTEAALKYADAAAEDPPAAFRAVKKNLVEVAKALGKQAHHHLIKEGLWRRKAAGLPVGRPPKLTRAQAQAAVREHGSKSAAARALGVDRLTIRTALRRNPTFLTSSRKRS